MTTMIDKVYIDRIHFNGETYWGDISLTYRFRLFEVEWTPGGMAIGRTSSPVVIGIDGREVSCSAGDVVPWKSLTGRWSVRFPDGIVFATGEVGEAGSLEEWLECLPRISSPDFLYGVDVFLHGKNARSQVPWSEYSALVDAMGRAGCDKDAMAFFLARWKQYALTGAIREMTHHSPPPDALAFLKDYFQNQ